MVVYLVLIVGIFTGTSNFFSVAFSKAVVVPVGIPVPLSVGSGVGVSVPIVVTLAFPDAGRESVSVAVDVCSIVKINALVSVVPKSFSNLVGVSPLDPIEIVLDVPLSLKVVSGGSVVSVKINFPVETAVVKDLPVSFIISF